MKKAVDAPDASVPADIDVAIVLVEPASDAESLLTEPASEALECTSSLPPVSRMFQCDGGGGGGMMTTSRSLLPAGSLPELISVAVWGRSYSE
jgi:hypothetical protein